MVLLPVGYYARGFDSFYLSPPRRAVPTDAGMFSKHTLVKACVQDMNAGLGRIRMPLPPQHKPPESG